MTNNVGDAQSSNTRTFIKRPSDVTTSIWQVIMSALCWAPEFGKEKWELYPVEESSASASNNCFVSRPVVLAMPSNLNCKCNSVCCGLRHCRHFWLEVHWCIKMSWQQEDKTNLVFPHQIHELLQQYIFIFPAHVLRVFPNTSRHAACISTCHISRPDLRTCFIAYRIGVVFWTFTENH